MYTYDCIYVHKHVYECMHMCMYMYIYMYTCIYMCTYIYIHTYRNACIYIDMYLYTHMYIYIYICIYKLAFSMPAINHELARNLTITSKSLGVYLIKGEWFVIQSKYSGVYVCERVSVCEQERGRERERATVCVCVSISDKAPTNKICRRASIEQRLYLPRLPLPLSVSVSLSLSHA